jgi:Ca-activated chloride channel family protein
LRQLPLTDDRGAERLARAQATAVDLGAPATALSAARITAARTFEHEGDAGRRAVLVLSDGESGEGDMEEATAELRRQDLPVFAVGVGTAAGGPVPADSGEAPEKYHRNHIGQIVVSRLEEGDLQAAARASRGAFAHWDRRNEMSRLETGLDAVRPRALSARKASERADRFQWPLALAVMLLMWAELMARGRGGAGARGPKGAKAQGRRGAADWDESSGVIPRERSDRGTCSAVRDGRASTAAHRVGMR